MSIVRRMTVASIGLVLVGIAFTIAGASWMLHHQAAESYENRLYRQLDVLSGSLAYPLWSFDRQSIRTLCDTYATHQDVVLVRVLGDESGDPICDLSRSSSARIINDGTVILYQGRRVGEVHIGIAMNSYQATLRSIMFFGLVSAALISVFIYIGVQYLLRVYLREPLSTLSRWASDVAGGNYGAMDGGIREIELQGLARRFHEMSNIIATRELELKKLSMATEQSPASVVITDPHGNIEYVNQSFEKITGYSVEEVIGQSAGMMKSGQVPDHVYQDMWETIGAGRTWEGEFINRTRSGRIICERTRIAPVRDAGGEIAHYVAVKEDITLQKEQEERILQQAYYDNLTDLPNRSLCIDRLSQLLKEARRRKSHLAVLFLDMDDFKKINDTMGHEVGDRLLREAANRLSSSVREEDTVGRLGGDEFIILAGDLADASDAAPLAEHLIETFRYPFKLDGRDLVLTASIGVACFPHDGDTVAELLRNADTAMYHAKSLGRNAFHYFHPSMTVGVSRRLKLEERLQFALDQGGLETHYQPIVDVRTGRCSGVEALMRWFDNELGDVAPSEFIPVAEQTGLIIPLGLKVLADAVTAVKAWQGMVGDDFRVSVNLSPRQFRDASLVDSVMVLLNKAGVPGSRLTLEITEGVLMSAHADVDRMLRQFTRMGVGIAMDDFGTGYSSLSYLRSYPFTSIKLDRSFVNDLAEDMADRELVHAAIQMAHALGLRAVAEGVETEDQMSILRESGCDLVQGYLFGRPVAAQEMASALKKMN